MLSPGSPAAPESSPEGWEEETLGLHLNPLRPELKVGIEFSAWVETPHKLEIQISGVVLKAVDSRLAGNTQGEEQLGVKNLPWVLE